MNQKAADMGALLTTQFLGLSDDGPDVPVAFFSGGAQKVQPRDATGRLMIDGKGPMSGDPDDETAIDRVLDGDIDAFAAIVRRWQRPLVNLAYRFCRDRGRAEDMAQEAFLRAFRGLRSWRREAAFSTWLFALATNLLRSEFRRIPIQSIPVDESLGTSASAEDTAGEADHRSIVRKAVQSLPPKYRDPLLLFYFHDQDVAMTAKSLELREGTVKARLSRGRALLKSRLANRL
jgi:RNA polymerase sigma-70 factor, ECF subfamily